MSRSWSDPCRQNVVNFVPWKGEGRSFDLWNEGRDWANTPILCQRQRMAWWSPHNRRILWSQAAVLRRRTCPFARGYVAQRESGVQSPIRAARLVTGHAALNTQLDKKTPRTRRMIVPVLFVLVVVRVVGVTVVLAATMVTTVDAAFRMSLTADTKNEYCPIPFLKHIDPKSRAVLTHSIRRKVCHPRVDRHGLWAGRCLLLCSCHLHNSSVAACRSKSKLSQRIWDFQAQVWPFSRARL